MLELFSYANLPSYQLGHVNLDLAPAQESPVDCTSQNSVLERCHPSFPPEAIFWYRCRTSSRLVHAHLDLAQAPVPGHCPPWTAPPKAQCWGRTITGHPHHSRAHGFSGSSLKALSAILAMQAGQALALAPIKVYKASMDPYTGIDGPSLRKAFTRPKTMKVTQKAMDRLCVRVSM